MSYSDAGLTLAIDGLRTTVDRIKLHSGDPGVSGTANEIAGTQTMVTYVNGAAGEIDLSATVAIAIPASTTVSHFSVWDGATFVARKAFDVAETYSNAGEAQITSAKLTATDAV